ncbi:MAG: hypothetical protein NE330_08735, partial [Lentisphaeraceae bacterium]|nr:hypothetical protein [Lentisphaeraceae bacterium]
MKTAILIFIVFSISIAATLFQEDLKHHLRNKNAEQIAQMLSHMTDKSGDLNEIKNYIDLLDNSQPMNGVGSGVKVQDFAISALEQQTGIKASKSDQSI